MTRRVMSNQPVRVKDSTTAWEVVGGGLGVPLESGPKGSRPFRTFCFDDVTNGKIMYTHNNYGKKANKKQANSMNRLYADEYWKSHRENHSECEVVRICPYSVPGDRLWVREKLELDEEGWVYAAGGERVDCSSDAALDWAEKQPALRSYCVSIHMPRWASRLTLEITGVRVERLQDITEDDAKAEGFPIPGGVPGRIIVQEMDGTVKKSKGQIHDFDPLIGLRRVWDVINGPDSWAANPWVWVVSFRPLPTPAANPEPEARREGSA